ncbi:MAG: N-acetylmuramoyl-L-alanine amidase [Turicibacter sp.]
MTKVLVLDAGHGLNTAGKQTMNGSKGIIKEWTMNNNVCNKIADILKDYDVTIYRTDDTTGKTDTALTTRVSKCNGYNPDLFVSIHHNAGGGTGIEVYWHSQGTSEDKKIAGIVAPKLAAFTGMKNRGVKQEAFTVLTCKATAILVEGGFMDTKADYDIITSNEGQQQYAVAVAESIIEYLSLKKKATMSSTNTTSSTSTAVKVGDKVKVKTTATHYATGQSIASFVKGSTYEVTKVDGNKLLLSTINSYVWDYDVDKVSTSTTSTTTSSSSFLVEIICDALNIRQKADFNSKVVGTAKKGEVFTIVEESNGLGKLKSGAGYISLNSKYVKRK